PPQDPGVPGALAVPISGVQNSNGAPASVRDAVRVSLPSFEGSACLGKRHGDEREGALGRRLAELGVDARVVEARVGGVEARGGEINAIEARPVASREAHRARLAARIELRAREIERAE